MADRTSIEWCDSTWNPVRGCSRVSEGCRHCYAEIITARFSGPGDWGHGLAEIVGPPGKRDHRWTGKVALAEHLLDQPLRWRRPRRIFVNSTSDLFHEAIPDAWIDRVFAVMALAPQHTFQVLTKRPERMRAYLNWRENAEWDDGLCRGNKVCAAAHVMCLNETAPAPLRQLFMVSGRGMLPDWPLPNVWLGVSVEDQAAADARIPLLLATPAAKRFISAEPLLGPVDLSSVCALLLSGEQTFWNTLDKGEALDAALEGDVATSLDWVIAGGESGPGARPMHPDWPRALRDQCAAAGVPFFFKQWGEWGPVREGVKHALDCDPIPRSGNVFEVISQKGVPLLQRVGKKAAGASLDGREHREFPA